MRKESLGVTFFFRVCVCVCPQILCNSIWWTLSLIVLIRDDSNGPEVLIRTRKYSAQTRKYPIQTRKYPLQSLKFPGWSQIYLEWTQKYPILPWKHPRSWSWFFVVGWGEGWVHSPPWQTLCEESTSAGRLRPAIYLEQVTFQRKLQIWTVWCWLSQIKFVLCPRRQSPDFSVRV